MITQDTCAFYEDHAVYPQFNGVVLDDEEGERIVAALGNKKALILQNHGLLTAANTIESCVHYFIALEKCCQVQLLADAAAGARGEKPILIKNPELEETYKTVGTLNGGWFSAQPKFQILEASEGVKFEYKKRQN